MPQEITVDTEIKDEVSASHTTLADDFAGPAAVSSSGAAPGSKVTVGFGRSKAVLLEQEISAPAGAGSAAPQPDAAQTAVSWPVRKDLLGVEISVTSYEELADLFIVAAKRRVRALGTFLAVHAVVTAATDPDYRYRINDFDVVAPDGMPVRWAMNFLHKSRMPDRVCGPIMMHRMCARCATEGVGIYLYGSTPATLERLQANLENTFPGIQIMGVESPPFRPLSPVENQAACDRINESGAGIVFIGLGCPRQDIFAHLNRNRIRAVQLCVGAAFDFHAGNKKMAPEWMQRCGLEWTYRMIQEPRRLFKRYLITNTQFVVLMTRRIIRGK